MDTKIPRSAQRKTELRWDGYQKVSVELRRPSGEECLKTWAIHIVAAACVALVMYLLIAKNVGLIGFLTGPALGGSVAMAWHYWRGWVPDND